MIIEKRKLPECLPACLSEARLMKLEAERNRALENERQLNTALASAKVGTWHIDLRTLQTSGSKSVAEVFGISNPGGDLIEMLKQLMHPDDRAEAYRVWHEAVTAVKPYFHEYRIVMPDGTIRWVMSHGKVALGDDGKPSYISGILADCTARKQAEMELAFERHKLNALFEESPVAMAFCRGPSFLIERVNKTFRQMLVGRVCEGLTFDEAFPELVESGLREIKKQVFASGEHYTAREFKVPLRPKPGEASVDSYWDFTFTRVNDSEGRPFGTYFLGYDVTDRVNIRSSLQQSRSDLLDTLDSVSDACFTVNSTWQFTHVNKAFERFTGFKREEVLGRHMFDDLKPVHDERQRAQYERAMRDRVAVEFEDYYTADKIWFLVRVYPKADGGLAVFANDITEKRIAQQRLRESETNFRSIAEATPQMIWTASPDGQIDYANSQWYDFSGLTVEQTKGFGFASIIHPDEASLSMEKYQWAMTAQLPFEMQSRLKSSPDGSYRWFLLRALPKIEDAVVKRWYMTMTDIHDQKTVAQELAQARDEAERANLTKSNFLANMSHEIRTPLAAIMGFADLLKEDRLTPDERIQYLNTINKNGKALTRIIDDILDLAKVEAGKLEVEEIAFSLRGLLEDVLVLFTERAKSNGIYLRSVISPHLPERISSDPTRLRQILINIVGNAIKFTAKGGVTIKVLSPRLLDNRLGISIAVQDTGIGIVAEKRARLFKPFSQADDTTSRKFGGTGLGLVLSRRLANALGGDIELTNTGVNNGCTFTLTIVAGTAAPLNSTETESAIMPASATPAARLAGIRILLADDSVDNQFLARRFLTKQGAKVDVANNGVEAFQMGTHAPYDVVLMDIQMPEMDGYEATRALRDAGFKRPIIALTAHAMADERARTRAAGCDDPLTKPLNQADLIASVESRLAACARAPMVSK